MARPIETVEHRHFMNFKPEIRRAMNYVLTQPGGITEEQSEELHRLANIANGLIYFGAEYRGVAVENSSLALAALDEFADYARSLLPAEAEAA